LTRRAREKKPGGKRPAFDEKYDRRKDHFSDGTTPKLSFDESHDDTTNQVVMNGSNI
jgi:hypothetical protein